MIGRGESVLTAVTKDSAVTDSVAETFNEEDVEKQEQDNLAEIALIKESQGWVLPKIKVCASILF
jgi:hypothetical protein